MGQDISVLVEFRENPSSPWKVNQEKIFSDDDILNDIFEIQPNYCIAPFCWRQYGMFAFLAGQKNLSGLIPLSPPRGLPDDISEEAEEYLTDTEGCIILSSIVLSELLDFDYSIPFFDKRCNKQSTYRELLCPHFFLQLEEMKKLGLPQDVRIVFGFD